MDSTPGVNDSRDRQLVAEIIPKPRFISGQRPFFEDAPAKANAEALHNWEDEGGALSNSSEESKPQLERSK
jgi:hypothetical protein